MVDCQRFPQLSQLRRRCKMGLGNATVLVQDMRAVDSGCAFGMLRRTFAAYISSDRKAREVSGAL
jgi:hypothetical protein